MNRREKGNRAERKAVEELELENWTTYRVKGSVKFNQNVDIFGLFDILAFSSIVHHGKEEVKLIQVKTNQMPSMVPFREFLNKHDFPFLSVEIWVWHDRKGFAKRQIKSDLKKKVDLINALQ